MLNDCVQGFEYYQIPAQTGLASAERPAAGAEKLDLFGRFQAGNASKVVQKGNPEIQNSQNLFIVNFFI